MTSPREESNDFRKWVMCLRHIDAYTRLTKWKLVHHLISWLTLIDNFMSQSIEDLEEGIHTLDPILTHQGRAILRWPKPDLSLIRAWKIWSQLFGNMAMWSKQFTLVLRNYNATLPNLNLISFLYQLCFVQKHQFG
jgi:hypothetical protein